MKYLTFLSVLFFLSCNPVSKEKEGGKLVKDGKIQILTQAFQQILDSNQVEGSVLVYDLKADTFYSNDFEWARKGFLPASTFKITNSVIGLETGVIKDENTLFKWDGKKKRLSIWEQDMNLKQAFQNSCVPCYQQVARKVGPDRMRVYLEKLKYGEMQVDSSNIDVFWLEGESKISLFQQIDFLRKFYERELSLSANTYRIVSNILIQEDHDQYRLSGKTGWSIRNGNNNGWFVGFLEIKNKVYFFAANIIPQETFSMDLFPKIRKEITMAAFKKLCII